MSASASLLHAAKRSRDGAEGSRYSGVVTALAGYVVIMRGNTFTVGDRITMGGVRGGIIALTVTQTEIMEMGQPPAVQGADPAMWCDRDNSRAAS